MVCERELLKIGVRSGDIKAKLKAICPCGGESFVKNVVGRFSVSPEPGLFIHECDMPSVELDENKNLVLDIGVGTFLMKEIK